ncbi:MAG: hypothetical protein RSG92_27995 [Pseudomonas sp.]
MDTNKMRDISREQFEAWHASAVVGEPPHDKYSNGDYRNQHVQRYWLGWQASRTAVVVERPEKCEFAEPSGEYAKGYRQGIRGMVDAIEDLGLKVKP